MVAAILAAGSGTRFGADKTLVPLGQKPLWRWSFDAFRSHPEIDGVLLVGSDSNIAALRQCSEALVVTPGGADRQKSCLAALDSVPFSTEIVLIHDAARPFISHAIISRVLEGIRRTGAAAAAMPVADTIKQKTGGSIVTLDRSRLFAMQTPQGARIELLRKAHDAAAECYTDETAMLEAIGVHPELVEGDPTNFKITTANDLLHAQALVRETETRTGIGYDIHPFSSDPSRALFLGGVRFPDHPGLEGHSDADVVLHAATDALLGAAGLGDIGVHFPNTDERWRGEPSSTFLSHAAGLLREEGWRIVNLDLAVIAEFPKIMKRAAEIREHIAQTLCITSDRVSIKATTNERLGSIGRGEGIAVFATATISRR